jgi:hypothetical protein
MLALLAEDVAGLPEDLLEQAIQRHVATSPYMPKAADLVKLCQSIMDGRRPTIDAGGRPYVFALCEQYNRTRTRDDCEWIVDGNGNLRLVDVGIAERTKQLEAKSEQERRRWIANHRDNQPVREAAE